MKSNILIMKPATKKKTMFTYRVTTVDIFFCSRPLLNQLLSFQKGMLPWESVWYWTSFCINWVCNELWNKGNMEKQWIQAPQWTISCDLRGRIPPMWEYQWWGRQSLKWFLEEPKRCRAIWVLWLRPFEWLLPVWATIAVHWLDIVWTVWPLLSLWSSALLNGQNVLIVRNSLELALKWI